MPRIYNNFWFFSLQPCQMLRWGSTSGRLLVNVVWGLSRPPSGVQRHLVLAVSERHACTHTHRRKSEPLRSCILIELPQSAGCAEPIWLIWITKLPLFIDFFMGGRAGWGRMEGWRQQIFLHQLTKGVKERKAHWQITEGVCRWQDVSINARGEMVDQQG